jgi:hypothetical protein
MRVSEVHIEKPRPPCRAFRFMGTILAGFVVDHTGRGMIKGVDGDPTERLLK